MASFARTGRKCLAIGRNYKLHAQELGNAIPTAPFFFLKPTSSYLADGGEIEIPKGVIVHHEVELGVIIGKGGKDIPASSAFDHVAGYCVALDLTGRNMQDVVKKAGLPWTAAKGLDTFCPVSNFVPKDRVRDPSKLRLMLKINGTVRQDGPTSDMMFEIPRLIEHCSSIMTLEEGDSILTGTPAGVGPVEVGDKLEATLMQDDETLCSWSGSAVARRGGYVFSTET